MMTRHSTGDASEEGQVMVLEGIVLILVAVLLLSLTDRPSRGYRPRDKGITEPRPPKGPASISRDERAPDARRARDRP